MCEFAAVIRSHTRTAHTVKDDILFFFYFMMIMEMRILVIASTDRNWGKKFE